MSIQVTIGRDSDGELTATEATEGKNFNDSNSRTGGTGLAVKPQGGVTRVTLSGGELTSNGVTTTRINTADIISDRKTAEPDSILATRRTQGGSPVLGKAKPTDLVSVGGMEMTVKQAILLNYLGEGDNGQLYDAMRLQDVETDAQRAFREKAVEEPAEVLSSSTLEFLRNGTTGLSEGAATQHMLRAIDGDIDGDKLRRELESAGVDAVKVAAQFDNAVEGFVMDITSQLGLDMDDDDETLANWQDLVAVLKADDRAKYTSAMRSILTLGDASELVDMVQKAHNKTGMLDADTLQGAGYETKTVNGTTLVKVTEGNSSMWVTQKVARQLGAI